MLIRLVRLLSVLPLGVLQFLGAGAGWLVYLISARYRATMRANLPADLPGRSRVLRRAVAESGKQMLELVWVWTRPAPRIQACVELERAAALDALLDSGRAVLMLTPHLGCFEIIAQHHMTRPLGARRPMLAMYRVPRKALLRPLLEEARQRHGLLLAPADLQGVRRMMRALREGQIVGLLPDQVPSRGEGVWAPFFGRPAYTMTLPARLAHNYGAAVVLIAAHRRPHGAGYRIVWDAIDGALSGDPAHDAAAINRAMEAMIRRAPEQYLWAYNRYKRPAGAEPPPSA